MFFSQRHLPLFKLLAWFVSLGIGIDNAINTFYFLHLEHWSGLWCGLATISSFVLNAILYGLGAEHTLQATYHKIKQTVRRMATPAQPCGQYCRALCAEWIALGSAITMFGFTLYHYQSCPIHLPQSLGIVFCVCYFLGTYTLILQICKKPFWQAFFRLTQSTRLVCLGLWALMALATTAAGCQWWSGIVCWTVHGHGWWLAALCWSCLMLGELWFMAHVSLGLSQYTARFLNSYRTKRRPALSGYRAIFRHTLFLTFVFFNALGFAGMTHFHSWLTQSLSGTTTFILGFLLSLLIMLYGALVCEITPQTHHVAHPHSNG